MKYTLKIWATKGDWDTGNAETIGTEMSHRLAMEVEGVLEDNNLYYAYEVFETDSGATIYHSLQ
jgi:hypothetical protein